MGGDVLGALQRLAFAACFDAEHLACPGGVAQRLSDMQLARVPPRRCRVRAVVERVEVAYAWGTLYRRAFRDVDEHETVHALAFEAIGSPRLPRQPRQPAPPHKQALPPRAPPAGDRPRTAGDLEPVASLAVTLRHNNKGSSEPGFYWHSRNWAGQWMPR